MCASTFSGESFLRLVCSKFSFAIVRSSLTRELPHNVPFAAKVALIQRCFAEWDAHCARCFDAVHAAAAAELRAVVRTHFAGYRGTALMDHVDAMVEGQVERCRVATQERIKWMLALESPPFTNNDHYFTAYREKYLTKYKDARKVCLFSLIRDFLPLIEVILKALQNPINAEKPSVSAALSALAGAGFQGLKEEDLSRLYGAERYEEELIVMAETAAYFHVAYKVCGPFSLPSHQLS